MKWQGACRYNDGLGLACGRPRPELPGNASQRCRTGFPAMNAAARPPTANQQQRPIVRWSHKAECESPQDHMAG